MSTINVSIVDQNLTITNAPLIASGDINVDYVEFSFDGTWDGYGVVAVFYRDGEQQVYRSVVSPATNKALVPHEVLADEGRICFGVVGQKGNLTKTSVIGYYDIKRGAVTTGVDTQPPTPGIYEQMLEAVGDAKDAFDAALLEAEQLAGRVVICDCLAADLPSVVNTYGTLRRISLPEDMALADFDRVTVQLSNVGRNDLASGSTGQLVLLTNNDIQLGTITVPSTGGSAFIELAGLSGSPGNNIFRWSSVSNYGGATQEKKDTMASWGTEGVLANAERIDMLLTNDTYVRVIGYCNEVAGSTEGGGYVPPPTGIPASDLAPTVRAVLEKADAAKAFEVVDAVSASGSGFSRTVLLDCDFNDADDPAVLADLIIINLGDVLDGWAPDGTMLYEDRNDNGTPTFSSLPFISSGSAYFLTATMTVGAQSTSISVTKNAIASSSGGSAPSGGWGTNDLADGAVTTAKLAAGAVTEGKIADNAVTSGKLAAAVQNRLLPAATAADSGKVPTVNSSGVYVLSEPTGGGNVDNVVIVPISNMKADLTPAIIYQEMVTNGKNIMYYLYDPTTKALARLHKRPDSANAESAEFIWEDTVNRNFVLYSLPASSSSSITTSTVAFDQGGGGGGSTTLPELGGGYATASGGSTVAQSVTITGFVRTVGNGPTVKFTSELTAKNPTLNVNDGANDTGAAAIWYCGSVLKPGTIRGGALVKLAFDGTHYCVEAIDGRPVIQLIPNQGVVSISGTYQDLIAKLKGAAVPQIICATPNTTMQNLELMELRHVWSNDTTSEIKLAGRVGGIEYYVVLTQSGSSGSEVMSGTLESCNITPDVVMQSSTTPTIAVHNNELHDCGTVTRITISDWPADGDWGLEFTSLTTATELIWSGGSHPAWPDGMTSFVPETGKHYELNVHNGKALIGVWPA